MSAADSTRLGARLIRARVVAKDPPRANGFIEETTLFVVALKKATSLELLDGLADAQLNVARAFAQRLLDLDSPTRQARLTSTFSVRETARERVDALLTKSPPALRHAIEAELPASWRNSAARPAARTPALARLARRLIRGSPR